VKVKKEASPNGAKEQFPRTLLNLPVLSQRCDGQVFTTSSVVPPGVDQWL
jgi:hypothetical protein